MSERGSQPISTFTKILVGCVLSMSVIPWITKDTKVIIQTDFPRENSEKLVFALMATANHWDHTKYWIDHFYPVYKQQKYADSLNYWLETEIDNPDAKNAPIRVVNVTGDPSRYWMVSKLRGCLMHFLYETSANWLVRICGDTAVNFNTVPDVLVDLNKYHDPLWETVVQGACLGKFELTYIQGGSGFIFSRRAAYELLKDWEWFTALFPEQKNDDRGISIWLHDRANISFYNASNRFFVGHAFRNYTAAIDAVSSPWNHPCPKVPPSKKGCRPFFTRIRDLPFWHDRTKFENFIWRIDEIREKAGEDAYFYVPINKPIICTSKRDISGYY